jgi:glycosyltransferase involved in cell wall biosynthesis
VAVSDDLRRVFGFTPTECCVIPNGVRIPAEPVDLAATRAAPVIGWIGRMVPIKDLPLLLDAVAALPPALSHVRLLLVGDGPEREACERRAREAGIAARVEWAGFVDDPGAALARMSVFALPSRHEGLPLAMLEAMAAGVPCVVAAVGGIPAAIGDSGAATLVSERTPAAWAAALARVLGDPAEAARSGRSARARVADHFTLERCAERYLGVYRASLGEVPADQDSGT